jgi:hypothetical protein
MIRESRREMKLTLKLKKLRELRKSLLKLD